MAGTASSDRQTAARAARTLAASWMPPAFAHAVASVIVMAALVAGTHSLPTSGVALAVTAIPTFLAPLFSSRELEPHRALLSSFLGWALAVLLLACLSWLVLGVHLALAPLGLASLLALGILMVVHQGASLIGAALQRMAVDAATAREISVWGVTAVLWLAGSTPIWLGPVAELGGRLRPMTPTFILACSPLAQLAAAAGHDLLRGEWFYAHSSLGSLQVEYPRVDTWLVAYALAAATLSLLLVPFRRGANPAAGAVSSISSLERYS